MSTKVVISGTFDRAGIDALREDLKDVQVVLTSGFGGERMLTALGDFTDRQWERLRAFVLRLVGAGEIEEISIDGEKIVLRGVSEENLATVVTQIRILMDRAGSRDA